MESIHPAMTGLAPPAKGVGPQSDFPPGRHAQRLRMLETGQSGDGFDRQVGLHEQLFYPVEFQPQDIGVRRASHVAR